MGESTDFVFPYEKNLIKHFRSIDKVIVSNVKNVDLIYLINLDQRPEKLERTLRQFSSYGIRPNRLSAVYGWSLTNGVFEDVGLKLAPGMNWKGSIYLRQNSVQRVFQPSYGSAIFYPRTTHGLVGCTLSHLSILQNAYEANAKSIWILEDDVTVKADPHSISNYMEKLDALVGNDGWDILYTDDLAYFEPFTPGTVWRPDMPSMNFDPLFERKQIGQDFNQIGGRCQTHSMIVRRSGIRKILEFAKQHGIYLPYDVEIAFVPDIRFFNLKHNIVVGGTLENSDTIRRYF
jgi:GR25 family glycosyltransferase involved in LPS biosynthesis